MPISNDLSFNSTFGINFVFVQIQAFNVCIAQSKIRLRLQSWTEVTLFIQDSLKILTKLKKGLFVGLVEPQRRAASRCQTRLRDIS